MLKILVVGSGAREHAIVWALQGEPEAEVFCAPGNAGIAETVQCVSIKANDLEGLCEFAKGQGIALTVVGPEAPIVAGIADRFRAEGLLIFAPSARAAQSEGSKAWFKSVLRRHGILTPWARTFSTPGDAHAYIQDRGAENIAIKADGLAGGKGVVLPATIEEASDTLEEFMVNEKHGAAGRLVLVEDRLSGEECSVTAIADGQAVYPLPLSQDYKRLKDGNGGPNTGGMGAHTSSFEPALQEELQALPHRVAEALAAGGCPYQGFLYLGIMLTKEGPQILECNCRLGDPEAQVLLPSIDGNFAELCLAAAEGDLFSAAEPRHVREAVCVVLASGAYPEQSERDDPIEGIAKARQREGVLVFQAGTGGTPGAPTTNKQGRIAGVVGVDGTLEDARKRAYGAVGDIYFPSMHFRRDIGA